MLLKVNGVLLYYEVCGEGAPLIMLHGSGGDHTTFDVAAQKLKARFTLYLIDTRGHGQSDKITEYHYEDMAQDVHDLILALKLNKPMLYGFSDGGIIGLLVASKWPELLSKLVVSGANTVPSGLRAKSWIKFAAKYLKTGNKRYRMIATEPHMTDAQLKKITVPTFVLAGSGDIIKLRHTKYISRMIKGSTLRIFDGESHSSYVSHSDKIADYLLSAL